MALSADRDGFLVGEKVQVDTASMERSLEIWRGIRADTREVLNILRGSGIRRGVAGSRSGPQQAKTTAALPRRVGATSRVAAKASEPTRAQVSRPAAPRTAAVPKRDERGRFISAAKRAGAAGSDSPRSTPSDGGSGAIGRAASAIANALRSGAGGVADGAEGIDPLIGAAKEAQNILSPLSRIGGALGGGVMGLFQNRQERKKRRLDAEENAEATAKKQTPWFRRILRALGNNGGEGTSAGGGLLSSLLTMFAGRGAGGMGGGLLSGLFGGFAARAAGGGVLGRLFSGAKGLKGLFSAGGLKTLGTAALPLTAIASARDSFGRSSEEYAQRYGADIGNSFAKDLIVRAMGVMQDFGNAITGGLADKLGNWVSGLFNRPSSPEKPSGGQTLRNAVTNPFWKWGGGAGGSGGGGGGGSAPPTGPLRGTPGGSDTGNRLMTDLMRDYALTPAQAAGFVGNLAHESGDFKTLQEIKPTVVGSRGGYGYAQWTGPRRRAFEKWARERNLNPASYEANYGFLRHELDNTSEKGVLSKLRATDSAADAASVVSKNYLRPGIPHLNSRIGRANQYLSGHGAPASPPQAKAWSAVPSLAPAVPKMPPNQIKPTAAPKVGQTKLPPAPSLPVQIGSAGKAPDPVEVIIPQHLGQNLSDRGIAQLATGGMGGGGLGMRMT